MQPNLTRKLPGSVDNRIVDCMSSLVRRRYCTYESHQVNLFTALPAQHKLLPSVDRCGIGGKPYGSAVLPASAFYPHTNIGSNAHHHRGEQIQIGRSPTPKTAGLRLACLGELSKVMGGSNRRPLPDDQ